MLDELITRGLTRTAENEKIVRLDLRRKYGPAYLARLAQPRIEAALKANLTTLIDAVASVDELEVYQTSFSECFDLVAIESLFQLRAERLALRGARAMSELQIRERDDLERTQFKADEVFSAATINVVNDGSLEAFHFQVRQKLGF